MELNQLEYFVALAHIKNFTKAAKSLNVSQPALSRSIGRLEKDLNVKLFARDSRKVALTQYGQTFLSYAERILLELETARQDIMNMAEPDSGVINLSFMHSLGAYLVPDLVKEFRKLYPKIQFSLNQNHSFLLSKQLFKGESDLCLCSAPINMSDIAWVPLLTEKLYIIVPTTHPLAQKDQISLEELSDWNFITMNDGTHEQIRRSYISSGFGPKRFFRVNSYNTKILMTRANLGISTMPDFMMPYLPKDLHVLNVVPDYRPRRFVAAWLIDNNNPAVKNFIDILTAEIEKDGTINPPPGNTPR